MPAESIVVNCPHCWQRSEREIDIQTPHLVFVEDCEVCCNPMRIEILKGAEGLSQVMIEPANE